MYGREYLDWRDKERVAGFIDEFLADLDQEDRVLALAILRERHTVYKEGSQMASLLSEQLAQQNVFNRHRGCGSAHIGNMGLGSILGF